MQRKYKQMQKIFIIGLFILQLSLINTLAQQANQKQDELGCATEEGKKLSFLLGNWKVKSKFRVGNNPDKWEETVGTAKINFLFDNCLVQEKLDIKRDGRPLTVISMYSYNNFTNNYQWIFAHSEHGLLTLFEGELNNGKFILKNSLEIQGRTILFERHLVETKNGFDLTARRSFDNGKTWRTDWYLEYYR
jgi:hypothetical protein